MGYHNHVAIVKKEYVDQLRKCKTYEDVVSVYKQNHWKIDKYADEPPYCAVWEIDMVDEHDLGDFDYVQAVYDHSKEIFSAEELTGQYADDEFRYGDGQILLDIIEEYRQKTASYYENILNDTYSWDPENIKISKMSDDEKLKHHYNRMLKVIHDRVTDWKDAPVSWNLYPYNLDKTSSDIVRSWDREYAIFELVRLYKMFDPEKHYVLYYGY